MKDRQVVAVIGTNGLPANYGGWETLVDHLTRNLTDKVNFVVYCSSPSYGSKTATYNGAKLIYLPIKANGVQSIIYDITSMVHAMFYAKVLLILGVSGCIFLPVVKLFSNKKIIVNIDGIEWKRGKWGNKAKWFLKFSEKIAVKYADIVVTDNVEISNYVKQEYSVSSSVIAYGGDHTKKIVFDTKIHSKEMELYPFLKEKYAFSVCRIEPENNIHLILAAYDKFTEYPLVIIGNWDNSEYGRELKELYKSVSHIFLIDAIYEQEQLNILRANSYVYIHGHSVGGTNPSLVEAMFLKLPVIAFDVSFNRATTSCEALYFSNEQELLHLLETSTNKDFDDLSQKMYFLASNQYRWKIIANLYNDLFY